MRPVIAALSIVVVSFFTSCASTSPSTAPAKKGTKIWVCPVSGTEFQGDGHSGYYGLYEVHFCSRADAEQFASLPKEKRAKLAAAQVLPQKKITNSTCPLTGESLTAAAAPMKFEGEVIGFASEADANQFKSLPPAKQKSIIDRWRQQASGQAT